MERKEALLPCPFCGCDVIVETPADGTYDTVACVGCGAKVTSHEARKHWNHRHAAPVPEGVPEFRYIKAETQYQHMDASDMERPKTYRYRFDGLIEPDTTNQKGE